MSERIELNRKPRKCPKCGHAPVATILRGMLNDDNEDLRQKIAEGRVVPGGCTMLILDGANQSPVWQCTNCRIDLYRKRPES